MRFTRGAVMQDDIVQLLATPWVFSQSPELSTSDILKELRRRGVAMDSRGLRAMYRYQVMPPFMEITGRKTVDSFLASDVPLRASSVHYGIAQAASEGRLRALVGSPYRRWIRFDERRTSDPKGWGNGLYYSRWQALAAPEVSALLAAEKKERARRAEESKERTERLTRIARLLAAIEAIYWPTLDAERLTITNDWDDQWSAFRDQYQAREELDRLGADIEMLVSDADFLLSRASRLDPTGDWSRLIRRAPSRTWKTLTGDALIAIEHRAAAEMLLRFYEDVTGKVADPVQQEERLSYRSERYMDRELGRLGISPHPGVVLMAEGETEQYHYPRVLGLLGIRTDPDLIQLVCARGSHKLTLLAAAVAGPLIGERRGDAYELIRTPTQLVISTDPDKGWETQEQIAKQRRELMRNLRLVAESQGASVDPMDLEHLVHIHVWSAGCFEFTHFTDRQIAGAIRRTANFPTTIGIDVLISTLQKARTQRQDVRAAWRSLGVNVDKLDLAVQLWPILERSIRRAISNPSARVPEIAIVASHAYKIAVSHSIGNFVINAAPPGSRSATHSDPR